MKSIINLIQVKKIIAIAIVAVFCYLSIIKYFTPTEFLTVMMSIIGFYFGQSTVKGAQKTGE